MILMREVVLRKSKSKGKKFDAIVDGKTVSFGATGYSDFTQHKDEARKNNYIARHGSGSQNWKDLTTAGAWSRWLLWERKTISEAIRHMEQKFNIKIKVER